MAIDQRPPALISIPDIPYRIIGSERIRLDMLYPAVPSPAPMPVIIFIASEQWNVDQRKLNPTAYLAEMGFFTISISHRLSTQAQFPAQIEDAKAAVHWVRSHAESCYLDPHHIGVWGISSGGHLAALLGTSAGITDLEGGTVLGEDASSVQAVATMASPIDLTCSDRGLGQNDSPCALLLGGPVEDRLELAQKANPLTHIRSNVPPFLVIHGEQDDVVPIEQSELLVRGLAGAGVDVTLARLHCEGHTLSPKASLHAQQMVADFFLTHLMGHNRPLRLEGEVERCSG